MNFCTAAARVVIEITLDYKDTILWEQFEKLRKDVYGGKVSELVEKQLRLALNNRTNKLSVKEKSVETWLC